LRRFRGRRVYLGACGMGLGHISRTTPIAARIVEEGGEVLLSTYSEGVDYARKYGLPVVEAPDLSVKVDITGSIDVRSTTFYSGFESALTFLDQVRFELQNIQAFNPDLVFADTRLSTIYAAKLLKVPVVLLLNQFLPRVPREEDTAFFRFLDGLILTSLGRSWALSKVILIPDFPEPYTISLDSLRIPPRIGAKVRMVGSILENHPSESRGEELRSRLGVEDDQVLIYAGISGPRAERFPVIRRLIPILEAFPRRYRVVMSLGIPDGGLEPEERGNLLILPWVENRFDYLAACDLVISRGGHETIMQTICYGKPSVIIPVPKHPEQYGNARRAMELGVARAIHQHELTRGRLLWEVERMLSSKRARSVLEKISRDEHLGDGLERVLETLAGLLD